MHLANSGAKNCTLWLCIFCISLIVLKEMIGRNKLESVGIFTLLPHIVSCQPPARERNPLATILISILNQTINFLKNYTHYDALLERLLYRTASNCQEKYKCHLNDPICFEKYKGQIWIRPF